MDNDFQKAMSKALDLHDWGYEEMAEFLGMIQRVDVSNIEEGSWLPELPVMAQINAKLEFGFTADQLAKIHKSVYS